MQTVLFVIHIMVIVALVGVVLLQRSEGGGLGIGGGGGFMTSRGTANVLTRATATLAVLFFLTSLGLSILPGLLGSQNSILDSVKPAAGAPAPSTTGTPIGDGKGVLNQLNDLVKQQQEKTPQPANAPVAPAVEVPAAPAAPAASAPAASEPAPAATESAPAAPAADGSAPAAPAPTQ